MEAPFRCPEGHLYRQVDGVAMGSPLGVLFSQAYIAHTEEQVIHQFTRPSFVYCKYIDDIFVSCSNINTLNELKLSLQRVSNLNLAIELSQENKITFLDVLVQHSNTHFATSVYRKPTDTGVCMNGRSECTNRYKQSVIRSYVNRAIVNSSTWMHFNSEMQHLRQMLVNNGFTNTEFDKIATGIIDKHVEGFSREGERHVKTVYYANQYTNVYKKNEKLLRI